MSVTCIAFPFSFYNKQIMQLLFLQINIWKVQSWAMWGVLEHAGIWSLNLHLLKPSHTQIGKLYVVTDGPGVFPRSCSPAQSCPAGAAQKPRCCEVAPSGEANRKNFPSCLNKISLSFRVLGAHRWWLRRVHGWYPDITEFCHWLKLDNHIQ